MCAAYSIATCRSIVYAKNNGMTDIDKISAESYSPYYIYHRAKTTYGDESWDGGMQIYMDKINRFGYAKIKDRKSVVQGKSVDLGGRRIIKKKKEEKRYIKEELSNEKQQV